MPRRARRGSRNRFPTSISAPSSPMRRALCCRSPIPPTSSSSAAGALARETLATDFESPRLPRGGRIAAGGLALTAVALLGASALGLDLGLPTLITAALTTLAVLGLNRQSP